MLQSIEYLLSHGVHIDSVISNGVWAGETAICLAAINNHLDVVRFLVWRGARLAGLGPDKK